MTTMLETSQPVRVAERWLADFASAAAGDPQLLDRLFVDDAWWRDMLALTWDFVTREGLAQIRTVLPTRLTDAGVVDLRLSESVPVSDVDGVVTAVFDFETSTARCRGVVRLKDVDGAPRAWTLFTATTELIGHEEHHAVVERDPQCPVDPEVVVIGAGHAGLTATARLMRLGLDVVAIERNPRVGDVWRNRYGSLRLHDTKDYGQFPYLPFPQGWPKFATKHLVADWLESYAKILQLPVRTSTTVKSAEYDEGSRTWRVVLSTDGVEEVLRPRHVVIATGVFAGRKVLPELPGQEGFAGQVMTAQDYRGGTSFDGRKVVVVGTGSSGHDIAKDACDNGADVTIVQRGATYVMSQRQGVPAMFDKLYSEGGLPVDDADLLALSVPLRLNLQLVEQLVDHVAELDRELLDGLRAAGFELTMGPGDSRSGLAGLGLLRGGGFYIDQGCSSLIVNGDIRVQHGEIAAFDGDEIVFSDGTRQTADLVVFATGFPNMQESIRALCGDEVAERVGPVGGLGDDGELRVSYRGSGQPGLWVMAGNFQHSRWGSRLLAIQIKAHELGLISS